MSAAVISIEEHRLAQVLPQGAASEESKGALHALGAAVRLCATKPGSLSCP